MRARWWPMIDSKVLSRISIAPADGVASGFDNGRDGMYGSTPGME